MTPCPELAKRIGRRRRLVFNGAWADTCYMDRAHFGTGEPRSSRAIDVVWFNYPTYLLAVAVTGIAGLAATVLPLPALVRMVLGAGASLSAWWLAASTAATVWVFELSGVTRWRWVAGCFKEPPASWLNITTGFDDTTYVLRQRFPGIEGRSIDVFNPAAKHDGPLRRARRRWPPTGPQVSPGADLPVDVDSQDAVFLLMAAHEVRDRGLRRHLLGEAQRVLAPQGRLVLAEHLRGMANAIAFGPGVMHFYDRETWLADAGAARLRLVGERALTPFATAFVFERADP